MLRLSLRWMVPLLIGFIGVGMIIALPTGWDSERIAFFREGCVDDQDQLIRSCWQGIHFPSTSYEEALTLLENHPWVSGLVVEEARRNRVGTWEWSEVSPEFLRNAVSGQPQQIWLNPLTGGVSYLAIATDLRYIDLWRAYGIPESGQGHSVSGAAMYQAVYAEDLLRASFIIPCIHGFRPRLPEVRANMRWSTSENFPLTRLRLDRYWMFGADCQP